jgi:hypothetical protein
MADISAISAVVQNVQQQVQNELGMKALKQAAQADRALADMLAQQARALAETAQQQRTAGGGISIYV